MSQLDSPKRSPRLGLALLWLLALLQTAFLLGWPVVAGIRCVNDQYWDLVHATSKATLSEKVALEWGSRCFRPISLFAAYTINPETLDARGTVLFHLPAYLALIAAVMVVVRRTLPSVPWAVPIALWWWAMHTSSMVILYSSAAVSHSWAAAAGLWLLILTWDTLERFRQGTPLRRNIYALIGIHLLGLNSCETYYGWCLAGAAALVAPTMWAWLKGHDRPTASRGPLWAFAFILFALPLTHVFLRVFCGGLGVVFEPSEGRYSASLGLNLWRNLAFALLGWFSAVPVHWARLPSAPLLMRAVPFIGILLASGLCLIPWGLRRRSTAEPSRTCNGWLILLLALASFLGVSATLPTGNMSEGYLLGVNIGSAILLAVGVARLLAIARRGWERTVVFVAVALVLVIGEVGVVSRAVNFSVCWSNAGQLYAQVRAFQKRVPPRREPYLVLVPRELRVGFTHGQYVHPPAISLNLGMASRVANQLSPQARVTPTPTSEGTLPSNAAATDLDAQADLILDGHGLARNPPW